MTDLSRGPDRLVHQHIKPVYDFADDLFPHLDADWLVDAVFHRAEREELLADEPELWQLCRYVVEAARSAPSSPARTAHARRRPAAPNRRPVSADHAMVEESRRLFAAHDQLEPDAQIALRLMTMVRSVPEAAYPRILGLDARSAERVLHDVRERFRASYRLMA